jgi:hypothetical protein
LEIILSLAIMAGSLVAIGEVARLADQSATLARDETAAQILASSVMDQLLAGVLPLTAVEKQGFEFEMDPPFVYSVLLEQPTYPELIRVGVRVEQAIEQEKEPAYFELYRWALNPTYVTQLTEQAAIDAANAAAMAGSGTTQGGGSE